MSTQSDSTVMPAASVRGYTNPKNNGQGEVKLAAAAAVLASLGICAACCLLPGVLMGLGVAGSFISTLDSLSPYRWIFIAVTAALLGYGFYAVYWKPPKTCAAGAACTTCGSGRPVGVALWLGTAFAISGIVYAYMESSLAHR